MSAAPAAPPVHHASAHAAPLASPPAEPFYYDVGQTVMVRGEGIYLFDQTGRRYLDCISGTFNLLLGHNHPAILAAVKEQMDRLVFAGSTFQSEPVSALADALIRICPPNLTRVHLRSPGGSTANEGAIRIAQNVTGKRDVITMFRGHLGQTMATISMSGFAFHRAPFPYHYPGAVHVPDPYCYRCFYGQEPESCALPCVSRIADFIKYASSGSVACLILEPIFGVGGNITPPARYFQELKQLCEEQDIILIFDEVQTGFGRTGHFFAADHFGVSPHMMTFAKGVTGSGFPLGGILTEPRLMGLPRVHHGFTYGGYPVAAAAALKTIEIISEPSFLPSVRRVGAALKERLRALMARFDFIGDVRGVGLMLGVEIIGPGKRADPARTQDLARRLFERGMIIRISEHGRGNVFEVRPSLILTEEQAHEIADRFEEACDASRRA